MEHGAVLLAVTGGVFDDLSPARNAINSGKDGQEEQKMEEKK